MGRYNLKRSTKFVLTRGLNLPEWQKIDVFACSLTKKRAAEKFHCASVQFRFFSDFAAFVFLAPTIS
jgi:hypothetical protein